MILTKQFYSPAEVAEMASLSTSTILNYVATDRLYAVKLSARTYRIPARAVLGLLEPEALRGPAVVAATDADDEAVDRWAEAEAHVLA